jgi:hypothetical protein
MNNRKEKTYDAVQMMRDIRDKLTREYLLDPKKEEQDLIKIHKKYGIKKTEENRKNI